MEEKKKKRVLRGKLQIQKLVFPNESTVFVTCPKAGATSPEKELEINLVCLLFHYLESLSLEKAKMN